MHNAIDENTWVPRERKHCHDQNKAREAGFVKRLQTYVSSNATLLRI